MLEYFKKRVSRNMKITVIVCAVIIVAAMAVTRLDFIKYLAGPSKADMNQSLASMEGKYVTFDADYVMANYIRTETIRKKNGVQVGNATLTSVGYIVIMVDENTNKPHYFGIVVPAKQDTTLKSLSDQFWDYIYGDTDTLPPTYHFTGSIRKIKSSEIKYWNDCISKIQKSGYTEYVDSMTNLETYTVDYDLVGRSSKFLVIICLIVMLLAALYAVFHVVFSMMTFDSAVKKFIAADPRRSMEKLDNAFSGATKISDDMFISPDYVFYRKGGKIHVVDLGEIVWAYVYTYKGTNYLRLYGINGKMVVAPPTPQAAAAVRTIDQLVPHCICGYNAELNKMFSKDLGSFLKLKYYPAKQAQNAGQMSSAPSFEMDVDGTMRPVENLSSVMNSNAGAQSAAQAEPVFTPDPDELEKELAQMIKGGSEAADAATEQVQEAAQTAQNAAEETAEKAKNPYDLDFTPIDFDNNK
ncbi:MAG: hypothetical protein IK125_10025 [Lachnospiraceae bacterium]|nr:hypothetical protein [Lachnospiraceae bacterium]